MDIIMLRHGETEDNLKRIFSRDDTKLTEKGICQISNSKILLEKMDYDDIYYSPLTRTVESKEIIGLVGIKEEKIREIDFGVFTGKTFKQILEIYPVETKKWIEDPIRYRVAKGENLIDVYDRIETFLNEIIANNKNVLLICHDCVIRIILCWVFDNPEYFFKFKIENGSISIISIDEGFKYIKRINYK